MKPKDLNIRDNIPYGTKSHMLVKQRHKKGDYLIEILVYKVPKNKFYPEGYKYSLVLIKNGKRILGYDNHEHKGHHIHRDDKEIKYNFVDEKKLMEDFEKDIGKIIEAENEGKKHKG